MCVVFGAHIIITSLTKSASGIIMHNYYHWIHNPLPFPDGLVMPPEDNNKKYLLLSGHYRS